MGDALYMRLAYRFAHQRTSKLPKGTTSMKQPTKALCLSFVAPFCFFFVNSFAHADTLYSWSYNGNIEKFTSSGVGTVIANTGDIFNGSVGLAVDTAGNLYAGNPGNSSVTKYTPSGAGSVYMIGVDSVSGLAFDSAGGFFGTCPNFSGILKLSPPFPPAGIVVDYSTGKLCYPTTMAFDSSGNFYVANSGVMNNGGMFTYGFTNGMAGANTIEKFSPTGLDLGTFATGLNTPFGLAFDTYGNLFASNAGNNTIVKITPAGSKSTFANASKGLSNPQGLAFDSAGNLYVANAGNNTIEMFTTTGAHSIFADASDGLSNPSSIAITNVPEPATCSLLALGAVALLGGCRVRRRSS
jgi:hypothetical protein